MFDYGGNVYMMDHKYRIVTVKFINFDNIIYH